MHLSQQLLTMDNYFSFLKIKLFSSRIILGSPNFPLLVNRILELEHPHSTISISKWTHFAAVTIHAQSKGSNPSFHRMDILWYSFIKFEKKMTSHLHCSTLFLVTQETVLDSFTCSYCKLWRMKKIYCFNRKRICLTFSYLS